MCVCMWGGGVGVSGFALISGPLRAKVHHMSHSLTVRNAYLPIRLRFSSHIVTLFKTYLMFDVAYNCRLVSVYRLLLENPGFSKKKYSGLITSVGGRCCFFLPPDEENAKTERSYVTRAGLLKPL